MAIEPIPACRIAFDIVRKMSELVDGDMPWHQGLIFLIIANADPEEGITQGELGRMTGLSSSSVSRNIASLGEWHRLQRPGLQLIETREDLRDRRRKPIYPTAKGREVRKELANALNRSIERNTV